MTKTLVPVASIFTMAKWSWLVPDAQIPLTFPHRPVCLGEAYLKHICPCAIPSGKLLLSMLVCQPQNQRQSLYFFLGWNFLTSA